MALLIKRLRAILRMHRPNLTKTVSLYGRQALLAALILLLTNATAVADPATEYEVKAAFIHNIAKFVEWPAAPDGGAALTLCILGENPFRSTIRILKDKQIGGMNWKILSANSQTNLKKCRALFIAASESGNLSSILERIGNGSVLTLGDTDGYAERGVMVNFYIADNKVRFEINPEAARHAGLKISSQVLKLARIIQPKGAG